MTRLNCSANTCAYNREGICHSGAIKVEGVDSDSIHDVHCISFANVDRCVKSDVESECQHIVCNAVNCIHNENTTCVCENIFVSGNLAQEPKQTTCCSFTSIYR